jgi:hypothetical protein
VFEGSEANCTYQILITVISIPCINDEGEHTAGKTFNLGEGHHLLSQVKTPFGHASHK